MPNNIEACGEPVPQAKKIPHCAVKFDAVRRTELYRKVYNLVICDAVASLRSENFVLKIP